MSHTTPGTVDGESPTIDTTSLVVGPESGTWDEQGSGIGHDSPSQFHISIGAEHGGPVGVLVTHQHVRWLIDPKDADRLAAALADAAARARAHPRTVLGVAGPGAVTA